MAGTVTCAAGTVTRAAGTVTRVAGLVSLTRCPQRLASWRSPRPERVSERVFPVLSHEPRICSCSCSSGSVLRPPQGS